MRMGKRLALVGAAVAAGAMSFAPGANAAFPDFSDCPRGTPNLVVCVNIQSRSGYLDIKGFRVPIGESFQIRGGLADNGTGAEFIPPRGTSGVFSKPVQVPGGILGIDLPLSINKVTATAQLAGAPRTLKIDTNTFSVEMPLKLKLDNPIIGPGCTIGTNSNPVNVRLITGTTNPPAPNRPISGRVGDFEIPDIYTIILRSAVNVDNSFAIPGAQYCGLGLGLINTVINAKMKLPSAAGNNAMEIGNDVAITNGQI